MRLGQKLITASAAESATDFAIHIAKNAQENVTKFLADPDKDRRLRQGECKTCFYLRGSRIGGATCSSRPCGVCACEVSSGSTNVDVVCKDCSNEHELCTHCGGDIKLRAHRKRVFPNGVKGGCCDICYECLPVSELSKDLCRKCSEAGFR